MTVLTEREIRLLEFDQIRTMLASHTVTAIGKEEAQQLYRYPMCTKSVRNTERQLKHVPCW